MATGRRKSLRICVTESTEYQHVTDRHHHWAVMIRSDHAVTELLWDLFFDRKKSSFIPRSSLYTASRSFVQVQWLSVTIQEARQFQRGRATLRAIWKSYSVNSSLAYTAVYHNSPCKALARLLCNSFLFYRFDTLDVELLRPRNHGWQYKLLYKPMAEVMGKGDFRPHTAAKPLDRF